MRYVLPRQNKILQLAQLGRQALRAPHHAGLLHWAAADPIDIYPQGPFQIPFCLRTS
jgi:hypothetical protein